MAQIRRFNWLDDDLTVSLNKFAQGSIMYGRYHGFQWDGGVSLTANFVHTGADGLEIVNSDSPITSTPNVGEWKTKQGGVIQETAAIQATFAQNLSGNPRIDILVGQHQYVQSIGGAVATYLVIQGTPSPSPLPPSLTLPFEQVILGEMYIPDGSTDLTNAVYTPSKVPDFAGDKSIAHLERVQNFIEEQYIGQITSDWGVCYLDTVGNIIDLTKDALGVPLTGDALRRNIVKNKFIIQTISVTPITINAITPYKHTFNRECKELEFFTFAALSLNQAVFLTKYANTTSVYPLDSFRVVTVQDAVGTGTFAGVWKVSQGGEAHLDEANIFNKLNAWNKASGSINGSGVVVHSNNGNFVEVTTSPSSNVVKGITAFRSTGGSFMVIRANADPLTFIHNTSDAITKKLWLPNLTDFTSRTNDELFLFVEDVNYWRLIGVYNQVDNWHYVGDVTTGLGTTFVDYVNALGVSTLRFKKFADSTVRIQGIVDKTVLTSAANTTVFTLPVGYRPTRGMFFVGYAQYYEVPSGTSLFQAPCYIFVSTTGAITISSFTVFEVLNSPPLRDHVATNVGINIEFSLD